MFEHETMILENEAGFRALFQYATVGILVVGSDGRIELANPCIEELFGYGVAELIGQPVEILMPQVFRQKHVNHRNKYFNYPQARPMGYGLSLYARKKNGVEFPVEISLGSYKLYDENLAVAFITDITERKKTEEELLESKRRLYDEAEALKFLHDAGNNLWQIENLQQGLEEILKSAIALTKADKGNVQLFDAEEKVLRIVAQKGFEKEFLDYFREVSAKDNSACGRALKESKQIVVADTEKEWSGNDAEIARKSGFRAVQSTPLIARDGTPLGMISTHFTNPHIPDELALSRVELYSHKARSFIEKVRSHETIKKQNLELEDKVNERTLELITSLEREKKLNDLKSLFVSMASHEFRTPLSAILSSISLIESYTKEEQADKRKKHIERIKSSVKNLVDILNDFLSLEKVEQGNVEVINEEFNLHAFAEDIIEEVHGILKPGQKINLLYTGKKEVTQDQKILKNVLLNLLSNAIKYSKEGKEVHFSIGSSDEISIEISDEGIGIPEEEQENIFSKFFRAKNAAGIQGTGLGLNIVKKYVELLDGNIHFRSKHNAGTTFIINLPQIIDK